MSATTRPTHEFYADHSLPPDHNGDALCTCGRPKKNQRHDVREIGAEVRAVEARRVGERTPTDE